MTKQTPDANRNQVLYVYRCGACGYRGSSACRVIATTVKRKPARHVAQRSILNGMAE